MTPSPPIAFFDGIGTADSLPLVAGLDGAAARAGYERLWTTAIRPPAVDDPESACAWTQTRGFYAEFCADGTTAPVAYRTAWRRAMARAADAHAAFFCDLAVEQLLASWGLPVRVRVPAVWIVHQVPVPPDRRPFVLRAKLTIANPRRWGRQVRSVRRAAILRRLAEP